MAVPTVQGVGTGSETAPAWPAHATDDLGLLFVEAQAGTVSTPSGYTIIPGFPCANVAATTALFGFYKVAASGAEGAPSLASGTDHMWGVMVVIRGVDATNPIAATATMGATGAVTTGLAPGLQTTSADNLVLHVLGWAIDNAGPIASSWTNASLSSVNEEYDAGTVTAGGGGLTIASGSKATAGGVTQATVTLTSTQFASGTVALQPTQTAAGNTYSRGRVVNK
jgi:hypothetical protein